MSTPFMQLYVADYLGDTRHLTTEQHGAYLLLLMAMWRADGTLPNDAKKLARIAGCTSSRWSRIADDVLAFFDVSDGVLSNKRLKLELEKAQEKSFQRAEAGIRGGKAKALKYKKPDVANDTALPKHSSEPEPDSSVDKSTDAVRVVVDHDRDAWNAAVTLLTGQGGMTEKKARPLFGRLLSENGLEPRDLLPALAKATVSGTQDPQAYLTKAAEMIAKRRNGVTAQRRQQWV